MSWDRPIALQPEQQEQNDISKRKSKKKKKLSILVKHFLIQLKYYLKHGECFEKFIVPIQKRNMKSFNFFFLH